MYSDVHEFPVKLPHEALAQSDWADSWGVETAKPFATARQAAKEIVDAFPAWTWPMLVLRQILVAPFGLKGSQDDGADRIGIFSVVSETATRLVAGHDDKHLDFRIVVEVGKPDGLQTVRLTTATRRHNRLGAAYLTTVLPFHRAIIRSALSRIAKR